MWHIRLAARCCQPALCGQHAQLLGVEYTPDEVSPRAELGDEPVRLGDGYLEIPERSGLRLVLDLDACARYPYRSWRRHFPSREDGSLTYQ